MFGADSGLYEFIAQINRMGDADGEANGLPAFGKFVPVGNDVADQLRAIHPVGQLLFVIVAGDGSDAFQVWVNRRIDARTDKIASRDQVGDLRTLDQRFEEAYSSAAVRRSLTPSPLWPGGRAAVRVW